MLLCPNVPAPLHGTAPRTVLGDAWWRLERKVAFALTDNHCLACGVYKTQARFRKWVEGHEFYRVDYSLGRMYYERTVALCHSCHNFIHDGRMHALLIQGKMTHAKYKAIIQHGNKVLSDDGLERLPHDERVPALVAPWHKWRLDINGKLYKGKFKSEAHWKSSHAQTRKRKKTTKRRKSKKRRHRGHGH